MNPRLPRKLKKQLRKDPRKAVLFAARMAIKALNRSFRAITPKPKREFTFVGGGAVIGETGTEIIRLPNGKAVLSHNETKLFLHGKENSGKAAGR